MSDVGVVPRPLLDLLLCFLLLAMIRLKSGNLELPPHLSIFPMSVSDASTFEHFCVAVVAWTATVEPTTPTRRRLRTACRSDVVPTALSALLDEEATRVSSTFLSWRAFSTRRLRNVGRLPCTAP
jgi:hypothetical protein